MNIHKRKATKGNHHHLVETTAGRVLTNEALPLHQNEERKNAKEKKRTDQITAHCAVAVAPCAGHKWRARRAWGKSKLAKKKYATWLATLLEGFFSCRVVLNLGHCRELCTALCNSFFFFFFPSLALLFVQCRQSDYWVGFMTCTCAHLTPFDWGCLHVNHLLTSFWWHASVCGWLPLFVLWFELVFWQVALTLYRYKKSF